MATNRTVKPVRLTWELSQYTPVGLKGKTERELRKEYSRLRSITRKRLERLEASEFADENIVAINKGRFIPLDQIRSEAQLRAKLSDVVRFLSSKRSTVTGQREIQRRTLETLHERGYTGVTKTNLKEFGRFMEAYRNYKLDQIYDSERVAMMFEDAKRGNVDTAGMLKDLEWWIKHREYLANLPKQKNDTPISASKLRKMIEDVEDERNGNNQSGRSNATSKRDNTGSRSRKKKTRKPANT